MTRTVNMSDETRGSKKNAKHKYMSTTCKFFFAASTFLKYIVFQITPKQRGPAERSPGILNPVDHDTFKNCADHGSRRRLEAENPFLAESVVRQADMISAPWDENVLSLKKNCTFDLSISIELPPIFIYKFNWNYKFPVSRRNYIIGGTRQVESSRVELTISSGPLVMLGLSVWPITEAESSQSVKSLDLTELIHCLH